MLDVATPKLLSQLSTHTKSISFKEMLYSICYTLHTTSFSKHSTCPKCYLSSEKISAYKYNVLCYFKLAE